MNRRKTRQEVAANQPDERRGSRVKKRGVDKPFAVRYRLPPHLVTDPRWAQFPWAGDWHGYKKFSERDQAEQYIAKKKREATLVDYEFVIVDLREEGHANE